MYRRNTTARYAAARRGDPAERSQTLPRGFGRSRSAMSGLQSTGAPDSSTLPRGRYMTGNELKRQTAVGLSASGGLGPVETRQAKRASSTVSITSIGYKGDRITFRATHQLYDSALPSFYILSYFAVGVVGCHYVAPTHPLVDSACFTV